MSDDLLDFVDRHYRPDFEKGVLKSGYNAALFCVRNGVPAPDWLVPMIEAALRRDYIISEGRGRGRQKAISESRKAEIEGFIVFEVDRLHRFKDMRKTSAFDHVAQELARYGEGGKYWTREMVKAVYYRNR